MNKKIANSSLSFPTSVFLFLVFLMATFKVFNLDIWWHLKTGEYILSGLSIPRHDIFSHTASGEPWVPTQWLFQVVVYIIHYLFGLNGLILSKAFLAVSIMATLLVMVRAWGVSQWLAVSCLVAFAAVARFRFFLRPDILSFFFLALELYLLNRWLRKGDKRCFYFLPLAMFFWANSHSGVTIGLVILALYFFSMAIDHLVGRQTGYYLTGFKKTTFLLFISGLVTLVNPSGIGLYLFAIEHYDIYQRIGLAESIPPSFQEFPFFFILLLFVWIVQLINVRKSSLFHLLLLIFFSHLSLKTARMIAWWAIAVAPIAIVNVHHISRSLLKRYPGLRLELSAAIKNPLSIAFMVAIFFLEVFYLDGYHHRIDFGLGIKEGVYPAHAVDFVLENDIKGNMYNDQDFGGYILWRTYPERKVFNDPRMQVYYKLFSEFDDWSGLLDRHKITYAILEYPDTFDYKGTLFPEKQWALVYWDDVAMVYVRKSGENDDVIKRFGYSYLSQPYDERLTSVRHKLNEPSYIYGITRELEAHPERSSYRRRILLASLAYRQGKVGEAVALLKKAINSKPKMQNAYYHLGRILIKTGKLNEGVAYLKKCQSLASYNKYGKLATLELQKVENG